MEPLSSLLPAEHVSRAWRGINACDHVRDGVHALNVIPNMPSRFVPEAAVLDPISRGAESKTCLFPSFGDP